MDDVDAQISELTDLARILLEDVQQTAKSGAADASPREHRNLVRAVFASLEGIVYQMKQVAHTMALGAQAKLGAGELAMLIEEAYELDPSGDLRVKSARIPFLANFRFAFGMFAKAFGLDYALPVDGNGWQSLRKAVAIRDRLTHPKTTRDLNVSVEEIQSVKVAYEFARLELIRALELLHERLKLL